MIYESEARIVRMVFAWYTKGDGENSPMPMSGIVNRLTEMGIPTFADKHSHEGDKRKKRGYGEWRRRL